MIAQTLGEIFIRFDSKPALIIAFDGECVMSTHRAREISTSTNTRIYVHVVGKFERRPLDLTVWLVWIAW